MSDTGDVVLKTQTIVVRHAPPSVSVVVDNTEQRIVVSRRASVAIVNSGPQGPRGFQGETGLTGPEGPEGPIGPKGEGIETVAHHQLVPSSVWLVDHTWPGGFPAVSVVDSGNNVIIGEVTYLSTTQLSITFSNPFAGKAYLN